MKRLKAAIIVGAPALISAGAATPAVAGSNLCSSSKVCIYMDLNFVGLLGQRSGGGGVPGSWSVTLVGVAASLFVVVWAVFFQPGSASSVLCSTDARGRLGA